MGADASGIDVSGNAIAYASRRFPRCHFIHASYDELMAHDGRYDFIYSSEVIEHVNNLDAYIGLLRRLTTDNGHVYLTTPDIGSPGVPADVTAWDVFTPPVHVQFFDEATLTRALAGFDFVSVKRYADKKDGLKMLFRKAA
jgi:2-polyprenyl-3-methyl-5-hydroxy-6-metoxy-1,4-benzoquinol methylase